MISLERLKTVAHNAVTDVSRWWKRQPEKHCGVVVILMDLDNRSVCALASNLTHDAVQDALAGCFARGESEKLMLGKNAPT